MAQDFSTTIGLSANVTSAGQAVDFDGVGVSACTITNNSGISIQYTLDGSTWTTIANAATAAPAISNPSAFRLRKSTSDSYPVTVGMTWTAVDGSFNPAAVAITGGTIAGAPVFRTSNRLGMLRASIGFHNTILGGGATNTTWQQMYSCPVPFYAVQVLYGNGTALDMTAGTDQLKCSVAATEKSSDRTGPYQGGSKVASFTPLTFSGNSYPALPAASGFNYSYSLSDVAEVPSFAPTEGTDYKLMVRTWKNLAGVPYISETAISQIRSLSGSDFYSDTLGTADYTASNPGALSSGDTGLQVSIGAVFHTAQRYATILSTGDSISAGTGTSGTVTGYPIRTKAALAALGKNVGLMPVGLGSSTSAAYFARAKAVINAGYQPTFCIFPIHTRNDAGGTTPTTAQVQGRISGSIQFAEYLADKGIIPIIVGPTPENTLVAAGVTAYQTLESVGPVIAAGVGGAYVSTLSTLSSGASNSYAWANGSDTGDGLHPSDIGAGKLATLVAAAMLAYL